MIFLTLSMSLLIDLGIQSLCILMMALPITISSQIRFITPHKIINLLNLFLRPKLPNFLNSNTQKISKMSKIRHNITNLGLNLKAILKWFKTIKRKTNKTSLDTDHRQNISRSNQNKPQKPDQKIGEESCLYASFSKTIFSPIISKAKCICANTHEQITSEEDKFLNTKDMNKFWLEDFLPNTVI